MIRMLLIQTGDPDPLIQTDGLMLLIQTDGLMLLIQTDDPDTFSLDRCSGFV